MLLGCGAHFGARRSGLFWLPAAVLVIAQTATHAEPIVALERTPAQLASPEFHFDRVGKPVRVPVNQRLKWLVLDGQPDGNSGLGCSPQNVNWALGR